MKAMSICWGSREKDHQDGEVLEYALIAGLIIVAGIAVIGAVGTKVVARWNSLNSGMQPGITRHGTVANGSR